LAADGLIYTTVADQLLVFDPKADRVVQTLTLPAPQTEISLGRRADGTIVGLTAKQVYVYDPRGRAFMLKALAPVPIRCGFALTDDAVYFGSGPTLWRYQLPTLR
jgi:hypothetical protein